MFLTAVAVAIIAAFLLDIWLSRRQIRHVLAHQERVPSAFRDAVSGEDHRKAAAYTVAKQRFGMKRDAAGAVLSLLLLVGGGFAFIHSTVTTTVGTGYLGSLALVAAIAIIGSLVSLPFDYVQTFSIEEKFGFNRMTRRLFFIDLAKSVALAILFMTPLVLAADYAMRQLGSWWWLALWGIFVAFNVLALLIVPTFIMPLFNKFEPVEDESLKARIEALMKRCGFRAKGLFRMDGSKRSSHGNAFFTGFGPSKRIVLFDTLMERLTPDEIEAVLAHELGHFKLRHVLRRVVAYFGLSLLVLAFLGWLFRERWFYEGFGIDPAMARDMPLTGMLLFFLVFPLVSTWFRAIPNYVSRRHEFQADSYAANHARAKDLATALVKLHRDNASTLTPDPIYSAVNHSHPSAAQRIAKLAT
ncbi:M48 family metallopeptidase [Dongia deserti]|uniref:M48 family metallopeptidase n=1 Tax=Dongia deserti TaxID=2268030 RepID=UPI000E64E016|nr:M48 family metallopeptidase [Dongia deserti]